MADGQTSNSAMTMELGQVFAAAVGKKDRKCWMRRGCWAGQCGSVMRLPTPRNSVRRPDSGLCGAARLQTGVLDRGEAGTNERDARHVVVERTDRREDSKNDRTGPRQRRHDAWQRAWLWGSELRPRHGVSAGWPARLNVRVGSVPSRRELFHPPTSRLCVHWASPVADSAYRQSLGASGRPCSCSHAVGENLGPVPNHRPQAASLLCSSWPV